MRFAPRTMAGQMMVILALSLALLLATFAGLEISEHESAIEAAAGSHTLDRLKSMTPFLEGRSADQLQDFLALTSQCHRGHVLTEEPLGSGGSTAETDRIELRLAQELAVGSEQVLVRHARLTREDFSFSKCSQSEIILPMDGVIISLEVPSGKWFNAEVHPHEWHFQDIVYWVLWSGSAFIFIGGIAIFVIRQLSKPLDRITNAARAFGEGLEVSEVRESGPPDLRRAIRSFNTMQQQVTDEVGRRMSTLSAISHDVRTPLTALRIKAEMIDDAEVRQDLISSINKMEKMTASALEFLKGESRSEPMRDADLSALLESECLDFAELGQDVVFIGEREIHYRCRPEALGRAVRNLIDNAIKYANGARVDLARDAEFVAISVLDLGPGIPLGEVERALEPFERLSEARESDQGGFGLGLAVAKAISEGHGGELVLESNVPTGLKATIRLPLA